MTYQPLPWQIAIDSPAAAGAGTQAKLISKHFNLLYLDSGKIYRLLAYLKIKNLKKFDVIFVLKNEGLKKGDRVKNFCLMMLEIWLL